MFAGVGFGGTAGKKCLLDLLDILMPAMPCETLMRGFCCGEVAMLPPVAARVILPLRMVMILLFWRVLIVVGSLHAETSDRHGAYAHIMRCLSCVWADGHSFRASSRVWTWWHCKGFVLKLRLMFLVLISAPRIIMLSSGATARAGTPTNHVELPSYCDTNACGCNGFVRCTHHLNSWQGELGPCLPSPPKCMPPRLHRPHGPYRPHQHSHVVASPGCVPTTPPPHTPALTTLTAPTDLTSTNIWLHFL